jgi:hypothetical protein
VLVASETPFAKIVAVEISRELSGTAERNVMRYRSISQRGTTFSLHCADATDYTFESEPLVLFLFNPFGRESVRRVLAKLGASLVASPREAYLIYVNPPFERLVRNVPFLRKINEGGASWRPWTRDLCSTPKCAVRVLVKKWSPGIDA